MQTQTVSYQLSFFFIPLPRGGMALNMSTQQVHNPGTGGLLAWPQPTELATLSLGQRAHFFLLVLGQQSEDEPEDPSPQLMSVANMYPIPCAEHLHTLFKALNH